MRKPWQIETTETTFLTMCTKKRNEANKRAMKQFQRKVSERLKPEEVLIRIIGGG